MLLVGISFFMGEAFAQSTPPVIGYKAWLRADQGIVLDGSNKVSEWQDISGNGNGFLQSDANKRPALVNAALGNQPAVRFDGVDDGLWGVETMNLGRPSTVFVVYEKLANIYGYILQNSASPAWWIHRDGFYSGNNRVRNTGSPVVSEEAVAVLTNSATGTRVHVNGSDYTQDGSQTTGAPGRLALGGGNGRDFGPTTSQVAEVIVSANAGPVQPTPSCKSARHNPLGRYCREI